MYTPLFNEEGSFIFTSFTNFELQPGLDKYRRLFRTIVHSTKTHEKLEEAKNLCEEFYRYTWFNCYHYHKALAYAIDAHEGQYRKDNTTPYILHPLRVAVRVIRFTQEYNLSIALTSHLICAALLHDTVEDCEARYEYIEEATDPYTAELVFWLTDIEKTQGNRRLRKRLSSKRLARAPRDAQIVKLADIYDNIQTSESLMDEFFELFCTEKVETVDEIYNSAAENDTLKMLCAAVRQEITTWYARRTGTPYHRNHNLMPYGY